MNKPDQLILPCDCTGTCGVAIVTRMEAFKEDPAETWIDFYNHVGYDSLRMRARAAWRIFRGKDPWTHSITLSDEQLGQLAAWTTARYTEG